MANLLFITNSLGYGGAAKMLCFLADSLQLRNYNVCVVNLNATGNGSTYKRTLNENIVLHNVTSTGRKNQIFEIKKISRAFSADVIIGFTEIPNVMARIIGLITGKPSIISERGDPQRTGVGKGLKSAIVLKLINGSRGGVFQTEGAMKFYGKGLQKRGRVIPNPIFINGEVPQVEYADREKTVVSVGRLDNVQKRYDVMLKAFKLFSQKHPQYVLKLYGKGDDEAKIKQWARELNIEDKVMFMGLTTQPMRDIAKDGMFLITSDFEGISNSLLEAMAVGLPCVSTDHTPGGARLLITDRENGLLAPIGDSEKLAAAMCEFAEDSALAKKCGENAKQVVHRFAPERIIDMWEDYIDSI